MNTLLRAGLFIGVLMFLIAGTAFGVSAMGDKEGDITKPVAKPLDEATQALVKPRILGNPDAPVKIEEFASLSCGHCAKFHTETLPQIKENYIDKGKVYFVFNDFPLNASALHGSMTARCVPETRYFDFISLLFEKQQDWAFEANYKQILGRYASLLGLGKDAFEACIGNEALQDGLIANVKEAQARWKISSTPSFVINDNEVMSGTANYETFKKTLDQLLEQLLEEQNTE